MKEYPNQPDDRLINMDEMRKSIEDVIKDTLPDCGVNRWFIPSTYFASMLDKIVKEIEEL